LQKADFINPYRYNVYLQANIIAVSYIIQAAGLRMQEMLNKNFQSFSVCLLKKKSISMYVHLFFFGSGVW
jgi:hypothetical protein